MLESSKDVLFIVLAFSVFWITVFLCWMMYHLAMILKNANEVMHEMRERLRGMSESVDFLHDRVETMGQAIGYLTELVKKSFKK